VRLTFPRVLLVIAVMLTAFTIQVTFLTRIGLPGATPDLLLVVVLVLGMAGGPTVGAGLGFASGVLVDIAPPASGAVGQTAAVYAIAGYLAGHVALDPGPPDLASIAALAGLCGGVILTLAVTGWVLGTPAVNWSAVPWLVITEAVYAGLLAVAVLPLVGLMYRGAADESRLT
jgi:rod shape-determining protein MreD